MQKQAAPPRFRGNYPHMLTIPKEYLPREVWEGILWWNALTPVQGANRTTFQCDIAKLRQRRGDDSLQCPDIQIITDDPRYPLVKGYFPKLFMRIKDQELATLAGVDYPKKDEHNRHWCCRAPNFDKIDCQDIGCTCSQLQEHDFELVYGHNHGEAILYRSCKRTLFAAAKRQIKSAPVPDLHVIHKFLDFAKSKIRKFLRNRSEELFLDFGYSFNQWYNHLNASKQARMDMVHQWLYGNNTNPPDPKFEGHYIDLKHCDPKMFHYEAICKKELQGPDGKPRMVCSIPDLVKYVMGPVCWALEEYFGLCPQDRVGDEICYYNGLPCYCGGMNLDQMEDKINEYIDQGFVKVAEGDGSAFDNTQDVMLKELDRWIYRQIAKHVYHVPMDLFLYCSQQYYKVMDVIHIDPYSKLRKVIMQYAVLGTVFSGDCDTTLMNTIRMGLYNWYTNECAGFRYFKDYVAFSKGDDFSVMYQNSIAESSIRLAYEKYWLAKHKPKVGEEDIDERVYGLGQILKMLDFGGPESFKFCSLRAWIVDYKTNHIMLTRDPAKFYGLSKFSRKIRVRDRVGAAQYCIEQAVQIIASFGQLALFQAAAQVLVEAAYSYCPNIDLISQHYRQARDRRRTLTSELTWESRLGETGFGKFDIAGYNWRLRNNFSKILNDCSYWESVKYYEMGRTHQLTPEQVVLVNQQIEEEYPVVEFKNSL